MIIRKDLTYQVITPLYLGGFAAREPASNRGHWRADRQKAEATTKQERLRLARDAEEIGVEPFVSMWRWWFRALIGGVVGTSDTGLEDLRKLEHEWFGGIGKSVQPLRFTVARADRNKLQAMACDESRGARAWASYLGFGVNGEKVNIGTRENPDRIPTRHPRFAVTQGSITLRIVANDTDWAVLEKVIRVSAELGALGARQRRGLGSLQLTSIGEDDVSCEPGSELMRGASEVQTFLRKRLNLTERGGEVDPTFPVLQETCCRVKDSRSFRSASDALVAIRNQLRIDRAGNDETVPSQGLCLGTSGVGWRQRINGGHIPANTSRGGHPYWKGRDHDAAALAGQGASVAQNVIFGLPIPYPTFNHLMVNAFLDDKDVRRPSPLMFRVRKREDGFFVRILLMRSRFLPLGATVMAKSDVGGPVVYPHTEQAGWDDLNRFIDSCDPVDLPSAQDPP